MDLLFPKRCVGCGRIGRYFCFDCRKTIRYIDHAAQPIHFFHYEGIIQKAIKALKYRYVSDLASEFVSLIPPLTIAEADMLIPIPLHSSRLRERGYNQAEVLGGLIAQKLDIPMRTDILKRVKKTTPQVEMKKRSERLKNMEGVFAIHNSSFMIHNSRILLFDDVYTTGATMQSAANVLKQKGASVVWTMTMAR